MDLILRFQRVNSSYTCLQKNGITCAFLHSSNLSSLSFQANNPNAAVNLRSAVSNSVSLFDHLVSQVVILFFTL